MPKTENNIGIIIDRIDIDLLVRSGHFIVDSRNLGESLARSIELDIARPKFFFEVTDGTEGGKQLV